MKQDQIDKKNVLLETSDSSLTEGSTTPQISDDGSGAVSKLRDCDEKVCECDEKGDCVADDKARGAKKRKNRRKSLAKSGRDAYQGRLLAKSVGVGTVTKLKESLFSVLPVVVIVLIFAVTPVTDFTKKEILTFFASSIFLILGIALFNVGADMAMTPMGEHVGAGLTKSKKLPLLIGVGFVMGVLITVAEPDLSVLAEQVKAVMNNVVLIVTVGVGVGLFLAIISNPEVFLSSL